MGPRAEAVIKMDKKTTNRIKFTDPLNIILKTPHAITVEEILAILSKHGHATLLLVFSLPLCLPIQIPGLSIPFGLILCLIGLQMAFAKTLWLPKWILNKTIPKNTLNKVIKKIISISHFLQKFLRPRLSFLLENKFFLATSGILIAILSLLLSLPLPIPMTNLVSTLPIICFGLGFLEDDGVCILLGYFFSLVCFAFFFSLAYFGTTEITQLVKRLY
jgi:hypothetical protein